MARGVFSVVDLETTGFRSGGNDRIVEIGLVTVDRDGEIRDRWETLLNPERDLGPQHIHQISAREILRAPRLEDVAEELSHRLSGSVIVAHNLAFDGRFLDSQLSRIGANLPAGYLDLGICTMRAAPHFVPGIGRSLADCCEVFGVTNSQAHSAGADALATAELLSRMIDMRPDLPLWNDRLDGVAYLDWAPNPPVKNAPVTLRRSPDAHEEHYLERIVVQLPSAPGGAENDYLALLDRVLIDGIVSETEAEALVQLAEVHGIDRQRALTLNRRYFDELVAFAWDDEIITDTERSELLGAAEVLGLERSEAEAALVSPPAPRLTRPIDDESTRTAGQFSLEPGSMIVLTGSMSQPREAIALDLERAGFVVHSTVTRKVELVVAADPDSLSGKARKAHDYGIPVVGERYLEVLLGSESREPCCRTDFLKKTWPPVKTGLVPPT